MVDHSLILPDSSICLHQNELIHHNIFVALREANKLRLNKTTNIRFQATVARDRRLTVQEFFNELSEDSFDVYDQDSGPDYVPTPRRRRTVNRKVRAVRKETSVGCFQLIAFLAPRF